MAHMCGCGMQCEGPCPRFRDHDIICGFERDHDIRWTYEDDYERAGECRICGAEIEERIDNSRPEDALRPSVRHVL